MPRRSTRVDETPNRDVLEDLAFGLRKATALKAAIELEIFTRIAEGHRTVSALSRIGGLDERGTRMLLDSLVFSGLLTKLHGEYKLSPTAEAFLVKGKPSYYGDALLGDFAWEARGQLSRIVRTGKPILPPAYAESSEALWSGIAGASLVDWKQQAEEAAALWERIDLGPENGKPFRVLDIGSGAAILSMALASKHPTVRVTAIDRPMVLNYTKQIADSMDVSSQVSYLPGDATGIELRAESFELVIFANITDYLSTEQNIGLFRQAYEALVPNGRVLIDAPVADEERKGPGEVALAGMELLLFSPGGDIYTFGEYRAMLETAGFSEVTSHKDDWGLITTRKLVRQAS